MAYAITDTSTAGDAVIYTDYDIAATLESGQTFAFINERPVSAGAVDTRPVSAGAVDTRPVSAGAVDTHPVYAGAVDTHPVYAAAADTHPVYAGAVDARPVLIGGDHGAYEIMCRAPDKAFWTQYFDLGRSYERILSPFLGNAFLAECVKAFGGLRLLRQPVWETVCSFIISANNSINNIQAIYKRLSYRFGDAVNWAGRTFYAFPSPDRLAAVGEEGLRTAKLGYRAPYLLETAQAIAADGLPDLDGMGYDQALKYLRGLKGVGEKVADCVLLFSTRHQNALPVDVWIERALHDYYGMSGSRHAMKLDAQNYFGDAAGIAQQFLFHGIRSNIKMER